MNSLIQKVAARIADAGDKTFLETMQFVAEGLSVEEWVSLQSLTLFELLSLFTVADIIAIAKNADDL